MRRFSIREISMVDRPAQALARATIMKREDYEKEFGVGDMVRWNSSGGRAEGRIERIIRSGQIDVPGSSFTINGSEDNPAALIRLFRDGEPTDTRVGHRFSALEMNKMDREELKRAIKEMDMDDEKACRDMARRLKEAGAEDMAPKGSMLERLMNKDSGDQGEEEATVADQESVDKRIAELEAQLAKQESILALSAEAREFYDTLEGDDQEAFLQKSIEDQEAFVKAYQEDLEGDVVYKALDGTVFTSNDDERLVAMAKRADAAEKAASEERAKLEKAELTKRAESELANLPGDTETKVDLLKAVGDNEKILEILKSANETAGLALDETGQSGAEAPSKDAKGDAQKRLDELAKARAEADKIDYHKAYNLVLKTEEGRNLYKQMV
jgi:hypothetical protein